jgi:hypothetical protein
MMISYWYISQSFAQDDITTNILQQINTNPSPRESLVQWYYSMNDFYAKISGLSWTHKALPKISAIRATLSKKLEKKDKILTMGDIYRSGVTTSSVWLSNICKDRYQLVDDRSYAFNIPTPLVLATLDMESSCGRYKPSNGDGVFQLIAKDYGTWTLTTGHWIMMMYDFSALISGKHARYHTANKLSKDDCSKKNINLTGTTSPICLTYTNMDLDSIIKHGALYNGLSWAIIKWDIQPAAASYVYGHYTDAYSGAVKDGLIVRILKVVQYMKENNK